MRVLLVALLVALPACARQPSARGRCERAHPKETIVAAYPTTVAAVRAWRLGLDADPPGAKAFPGERPDTRAYWCYYGADGEFLFVSAVVPGQEPYTVVSGILRPTPDGPLAVPGT